LDFQIILTLVYPQLLIVLEYLKNNLRLLRESRELSQIEMSHQLGFSRGAWNNYERGISKPSLDDLVRIATFFDVQLHLILEVDLSNRGKLIEAAQDSKNSEKGKLIGKVNSKVNQEKRQDDRQEEARILNIRMPQVITIDTQGNENVVLVPVRARAGYLNGYGDPKFIEKLPAYRLPGLNNGSFRLFEVEGLSMHPTLHGGDLVIGQNIEQLQDVRDDRVYVVVTKEQGVVVKRCLNRLQKDGKLILKSDNYKDRDLYPPIVCNPEDILEIWYATGFISRQMRPPSEMYNRVIDLEGRLTLMEDAFRKSLK
jgi:transcriptional regulator with XRE-family HTH domain/signal peptidase I